jgi:coniferyl-aldehyde dehydrogenase
VKTYRNLDEVIGYVNSKDRPLGFYIFTNDKATEEKLLYSTISGGVTINGCMLHAAQHDMPFGGVGASGMGHYHGYEGFLTFSKLRPVFHQARWSSMKLLSPPYGKLADRLLAFLTR